VPGITPKIAILKVRTYKKAAGISSRLFVFEVQALFDFAGFSQSIRPAKVWPMDSFLNAAGLSPNTNLSLNRAVARVFQGGGL